MRRSSKELRRWSGTRKRREDARKTKKRKEGIRNISLCKASQFHCCLLRTDWFSKCEKKKKKHFKPNVLHPEFKYHKFEWNRFSSALLSSLSLINKYRLLRIMNELLIIVNQSMFYNRTSTDGINEFFIISCIKSIIIVNIVSKFHFLLIYTTGK